LTRCCDRTMPNTVGVKVGVGVLVAVGVGLGVNVSVGLELGDGCGVSVGLAVGREVGLAVGEGIGVGSAALRQPASIIDKAKAAIKSRLNEKSSAPCKSESSHHRTGKQVCTIFALFLIIAYYSG